MKTIELRLYKFEEINPNAVRKSAEGIMNPQAWDWIYVNGEYHPLERTKTTIRLTNPTLCWLRDAVTAQIQKNISEQDESDFDRGLEVAQQLGLSTNGFEEEYNDVAFDNEQQALLDKEDTMRVDYEN